MSKFILFAILMAFVVGCSNSPDTAAKKDDEALKAEKARLEAELKAINEKLKDADGDETPKTEPKGKTKGKDKGTPKTTEKKDEKKADEKKVEEKKTEPAKFVTMAKLNSGSFEITDGPSKGTVLKVSEATGRQNFSTEVRLQFPNPEGKGKVELTIPLSDKGARVSNLSIKMAGQSAPYASLKWVDE